MASPSRVPLEAGTIASAGQYTFTQADVGKNIYAVHSNTSAMTHSSTILSVSGGVATITGAVANSNASGCVVVFGHDDTIAIQAAVTAACAAGNANLSVQLYFPGGGYWFGNSGVSLPTMNFTNGFVDLVGEGGISETILSMFRLTFLWTATGSANILSYSGTASLVSQKIRDLTFDGSTSTITTSNAYVIFTGGSAEVRNLRMQNFQQPRALWLRLRPMQPFSTMSGWR